MKRGILAMLVLVLMAVIAAMVLGGCLCLNRTVYDPNGRIASQWQYCECMKILVVSDVNATMPDGTHIKLGSINSSQPPITINVPTAGTITVGTQPAAGAAK